MLGGELISGGMVVLVFKRNVYFRDIVTTGNIFPMMAISREYKFLLNTTRTTDLFPKRVN
jgi:hypothetical protein